MPVETTAMGTVDDSGHSYGAGVVPSDVVDWQQYRARVEGGFLRFFRDPDGERRVVQGKDGTRFDFGLLPTTARACSSNLTDYGVRVAMTYEGREDVFSNYVPGWRVENGLRLKRVTVLAAGNDVGSRELVRRYHLTYDATSYHSLLSSVQVEGRPDAPGEFDAYETAHVLEDELTGTRRRTASSSSRGATA